MGIYETSRARLRRATAHGERLAQLWNEIPTDYLLTPKALIDPDGNGVLFALKAGEVPEEVSLLLGEMLYQLRSALDACIYQATIYATQKDPPPDDGKLEFPITEDPKEWKGLVKRRLLALPTGMQAALEKIQPFNGQTLPPEKMVTSINRSLGILNNLARKDRHRKLHVVGSLPLGIDPKFELPEGVTVESLEIMPPSVLREGTKLATFRLKNFVSGMRFPVNPQIRTNFGCDEPPPPCHPTDTFDRRLVGMVNAVNSVICAFEKHF